MEGIHSHQTTGSALGVIPCHTLPQSPQVSWHLVISLSPCPDFLECDRLVAQTFQR